jgi:hypothetical protein
MEKSKIHLIISIILVALATLTSFCFVSAETEAPSNVGVSFEEPYIKDGDIALAEVTRPTKVWNIKTKGKYSFSGTPGSQTLYTNYKFKGKTSYTFYVKNVG